MSLIYKISSRSAWVEAEKAGRFDGAPVDHRDGFIHFSDASQVKETAARHFRGESDLLVIAVDTEKLGPALKWEPSRGGALFPHLYGPLDMEAVVWKRELPLGDDGFHVFPELS